MLGVGSAVCVGCGIFVGGTAAVGNGVLVGCAMLGGGTAVVPVIAVAVGSSGELMVGCNALVGWAIPVALGITLAVASALAGAEAVANCGAAEDGTVERAPFTAD